MKKHLPLVEVEWEDAGSSARWEDEDEHLKDVKPLICHSVGWLASKRRDRIILVRSRMSNKDASHWEQIPRGCIRSMRIVEK